MKFVFRPKYQLLSTANDRSGIVSTYVSLGIISVLSLIAISFAALMQTEYTQARDRQFNHQARIAAETAINDARQLVYKAIGDRLNLSQFIAQTDTDGNKIIDATEATTLDIVTKMAFYDANKDGVVDINDDILQRPYDTLLIEEWYDCGSATNNRLGFEGNLDDADSNIEYTCVEVDGRPVKLVYDQVGIDRSENVLLQTRLLSGGTFTKSNISTLLINWHGLSDPDPNDFEEDSHDQKLPPEDNWGQPAPMLKVQIIPLNIRDGWTREELNQSTRTYFLYPTRYDFPNPAGIHPDAKINLYSNLSPTDNGKIVNADCDDDEEYACAVEISGFNDSVGSYGINNAASGIGNKSEGSEADDEMVYIVLIRPIYAPATVGISAKNSNGDELRFVNQQINITSTGRAGGLTYRLREVIPIRPKYNRPEYAVDSAEHICKVLIGEPDTGISYDYSRIQGTYKNPIGTQTSNEKAFCEDLHP